MNFRFADFEIDVARHELRRGGAIVRIEPQVFDVLVHLIRNRDRIVSRNELVDAIWLGRIVSEATLSSRISAARRALGDSGNDQSLIRTLHKRGFRFVGDVDDDSFAPAVIGTEKGISPQNAAHDAAKHMATHEPLPLTGEPLTAVPSFDNMARGSDQKYFAHSLATAVAPRPAVPERASSAAGRCAILQGDPEAAPAHEEKRAALNGRWAARKLLVAIAVVALASLPISAAWWLLSAPSTPQGKDRIALASEAPSSADRLKAPVPSIAVLPFVNLSGDAKRDYLADGITDSLISDLARALPGISIVSRDTAFTYKGRAADARQIGRELEVRYLLEGSVVLEEERVRVNTRLVETKEASQLWAERFDAELKSILQVQDEIVARVSRAIGLQVVDIEARRSWRERPDSAELVDLVLRGKAVLNLPSSPATMIEARGLFEQALKVEPTSVDGLAGVATTLVFEFLNGYYETGGNERLGRAEQLLNRALAIEPRHLMALKANAALRRAQGRFDDAIIAAEAVIMENPGEPWAYKEIGLSTLYLGKPEQALEWFAKADRIGPRDPGRWTWLDGRGHALILLGRDEEAVRALISALHANPKNHFTHAFLAAAYALLDRSDEARAALAAYLERRPGTRVSTFRTRSPVPLMLTSPTYQQQRARLNHGLRTAGMPE
ncbi:MAG TPA: winged helix-turn-helix domain-containing protein [Candidatus Binataceae bacterium]|nr:winged helix-turn-helix domain-containing protein [Candidatus Binataceae bacterium]